MAKLTPKTAKLTPKMAKLTPKMVQTYELCGQMLPRASCLAAVKVLYFAYCILHLHFAFCISALLLVTCLPGAYDGVRSMDVTVRLRLLLRLQLSIAQSRSVMDAISWGA